MKAMKLNYAIVCAAAALLGVMSCTRLEMVPAGPASEGETLSFTAVWADDEETKTTIQSDGTTVWWNVGEDINMFSTLGGSARFTSTNREPQASVTFTGQLPVSTGSNEFWAVYPYNASNTFDGSHVTLTVSQSQTATASSFASRLFPAIARTTDTNLSFLNVCGGAVFSVTTDGVQSVEFRSRNGESIAGKVTVGFDPEGYPVVESRQDGFNTVIVSAPNGKTFEKDKKYYAVFLPGTLSAGLSVTIRTQYMVATKNIDREITVNRSKFGRLLDVDQGLYFAIDDAKIEQDRQSLYETFMLKVASRGSAFMYSPTRMLFNMCGDDVLAAGASFDDQAFQSSLNEFRYDSANEVVRNAFIDYYTAINEYNRLLAIYADEPAATTLVAEGRVLRAYIYFLLAAGWGTPPLMETYNPDFLTNYVLSGEQKASQSYYYEWVVSECEAVRSNLAERASTADVQGAYKVTQGFADALIGKANLFAQNYGKAKTALQRVIDSGKYALVPGPRYWENFHIQGDGNEEKVFEPNLENEITTSIWGGLNQRSTWMESNLWNWRADRFVASPIYTYTGGVAGWGSLGVPQWFGEKFYANDGDSYRFNATFKHIDDAVYNMEYTSADINNMPLAQKKESTEIGIQNISGLYGQSFWLPYKQLVRAEDAPSSPGLRQNNFTIMRYAEVLLLYAEACLQSGDHDAAKDAINSLQQRAGSKTVSSSVSMDVLREEKSYELWLEGSRWLDLLRWNNTNRVTQAGQAVPSLYDKLFRAPVSGETVIWEHGTEADSRFYTVNSHKAIDKGMTVGFQSNKHERFPYPEQIMEANPTLTQNPGW